MKESKKKETIHVERKIYMGLLGAGIAALFGLTILYGIQSKENGELVEQNIEFSEQNPVSGQVASDTAATEESTEEMKTNAMEESAVVLGNEEKQQSFFYNGTEKMEWPINGNILIPYSMDTTVYFETLDQYQCNPGLLIQAEKGTEVKSSFEGVVKAVKESERYGQMITIDLGNGYETSYGQLSDISLKEGDVVAPGMVVGKIAEPTNYFMLEGAHLYIMMTKDHKAVNPTDYFTP